jgi:hypothetical protein
MIQGCRLPLRQTVLGLLGRLRIPTTVRGVVSPNTDDERC